jgi:exonuclease III
MPNNKKRKRPREINREKKNREKKRKLIIASLNIKGIIAKLTDLNSSFPDEGIGGGKCLIDILAVIETMESPTAPIHGSAVGNYHYISKPSPETGRGVGFLIKEDWINQVSEIEVTIKDDNILWIQLINGNKVIYLASVYVPYGNKQHAKATLRALTLNYEELSITGMPVMMGDFNARIPATSGDTPQGQNQSSTTYENGPRLEKLLRKTNTKTARSDGIIKADRHWTFIGPGGKSVLDYIIYPNLEGILTDYSVRWDLNCRSDHAMIMARINLHIQKPASPEIWGYEKSVRSHWDQQRIEHYTNEIMQHPSLNEMGEHKLDNEEDLNKVTALLMNILRESNDKTIKGAKARYEKKHTTSAKIQQKLEKLQAQRNNILDEIQNKDTTKINHRILWGELHEVTTHIHKTKKEVVALKHKLWWCMLKAQAGEDNSKGFWKLIKKLRSTSNPSFPNFLTTPTNEILTDKKEICAA